MMEQSIQQQTVPWSERDLWWGTGLFFLWLAAAVIFVLLQEVYTWQVDLGVFVAVWELTLIFPAWFFAVRKYNLSWKTLGLRRFDLETVAIGCGLMLISFGFNLTYNLILLLFDLQPGVDAVALFEEVSSPWPLLLGGVVIAPFVEELFFRGFIFAGLQERMGWIRAGLISSLLFAIAHLNLLTLPPILILGMLFAYLYHRTRSIWPAVIMHVLTNGLALGAALLISRLGIPLG